MTDYLHELKTLLQLQIRKNNTVYALSSGNTSGVYIDCRAAVLTARGHLVTGHALLPYVDDTHPHHNYVAGVALGGCPLASAVSMASVVRSRGRHYDALYVRSSVKRHGTQSMIEGSYPPPPLCAAVPPAEVLLLEDVLTTGKSALKAIKTLEDARFNVVGVLALVDRGGAEKVRKKGYTTNVLFTLDDLLE